MEHPEVGSASGAGATEGGIKAKQMPHNTADGAPVGGHSKVSAVCPGVGYAVWEGGGGGSRSTAIRANGGKLHLMFVFPSSLVFLSSPHNLQSFFSLSPPFFSLPVCLSFVGTVSHWVCAFLLRPKK